MLLQEDRPAAFESRKLSPAEVNYSTGEQELLAVVHALTTWRCYLEGAQFTVVTDHNPNTFLQTQKNLSRRQARWSEFLQRFNFKWVYRAGRTNVADPLSRNPARHEVYLAMQTRSRVRNSGLESTRSLGDNGGHLDPVEPTSGAAQTRSSVSNNSFG